MHFECDTFEDASWHFFKKQSEKLRKITHLFTRIIRLARWTRPAGRKTPHVYPSLHACRMLNVHSCYNVT